MFPMYLNYSELFTVQETIFYDRKSRTDDPSLTVEEILEKHEFRVDEWVEQNLNDKIPEENRFREIVSGEKISERPEFNKVLRLLENPRYKTLICYDIARLSRGDLEDAGRLIKLLRYTSTFVITVSPFEFYDLSLERDRDLLERALKRGNEYLEYTKKVLGNGKHVSVCQGNFIGSKPPYGYNKTWVMDGKKKCPTLEEDKERADVVRMIFDMYVNQNMGRVNIGRYLDSLNIPSPGGKKWSQSHIKRILENIHYIGKVRYYYRKSVTVVEDGEIKVTHPKAKEGDYLIADGKHQGIISEELFYAAQERTGKNHRAKPSTKLKNPLAGLVFCSKCGKAMVHNVDSKRNRRPRLMCNSQVYCDTASVWVDVLIEKICKVLEDNINEFETSLKNNNEDTTRLYEELISNLETKLKNLEAKELLQWEQQTNPDPAQRMPAEVFAKLNERLLSEKNNVKQAIIEAKESVPTPVNYEEKIKKFSDALVALKDPNVDAESKNNLLKQCIARIDYYKEKPVRLKSQKVSYYDEDKKRTSYKSPLKPGGNWSDTPIVLDIKLQD